MKKLAILLLLLAAPLFCQSNRGELHFKVTDPTGLGVKTTVSISSDANEYRNTFSTNDQGVLDVQRLPYGIYGSKSAPRDLRRWRSLSRFVPRFPPNRRSSSSCRR